MADPAYAYRDANTGGSFKSGSGQHYTTMKPETVAKMRVQDIMQDDSICFLWITTPLLGGGFEVLRAWGYDYKTTITWYKKDPNPNKKFRLGLGRYFRGMTEHCLVGTRGEIKPFACQSQNVIVEKPRAHSQKPEGFWTLIEHAMSDINPHRNLQFVDHTLADTNPEPRIELFCRGTPRAGWDGWGNECSGKGTVELDIL